MRWVLVLAAVAACDDAEPPAADAIAVLAPAAPPRIAIQYPTDRIHSPLTPSVIARLRDVIASGDGDVDMLAKIGDSHTVDREYLKCFATGRVHLGSRLGLRPTIDHFAARAFDRTSLAAGKGWAAFHVLGGAPSPPKGRSTVERGALDRELDATRPAFATVMFGTNDIDFERIDRYGENLLDIVDRLLARGVVPIVSSIPRRGDVPSADDWVPRYNAVARAVAQARQVPFVDLHRALSGLPTRGLNRDKIHLNTTRGGPCRLDGTGGNNRRNLVTLEALDRLRRAVLDGEAAPDADAPVLAGSGIVDDPFVIDALPFADVRDTRSIDHRAIDRYACGKPRDTRGADVIYKIAPRTRTTLRAFVVDRDGIDVDLHLLERDPSGASCIARADRALVAKVDPGTYYLAVDTFDHKAGEYIVVVTGD
jgi:hypothetical protein